MNKQSALKVMLTRPGKQTKEWESTLSAAGFHCVSMPMLAVKPLEASQDKLVAADALLSVMQWDAVIFVSSNAVNYLADIVTTLPLSWPKHVPCFAIGPSTQKAIVGQGWQLDDSASLEHNSAIKDSESLLALPQLLDVKGKRVAIIRGKGGRELIRQTLTARGATVTTIEVYQRCRPVYAFGQLKQSLLPQPQESVSHSVPVDAILFSSGDTVKNFCFIAEQDQILDVALVKPIVVPSERVAGIARQCGFVDIHVAESASVGDYSRLLSGNFGVFNAPMKFD